MAGALLAAAAPQTSKAAAALARETQQRASRRSVASAWLAALLFANAAIFVFKFRVYLRRPDATGLMGHGVNCARAFGQCAMLNTALLLAAACRRSVTHRTNLPRGASHTLDALPPPTRRLGCAPPSQP